MREITMSNGATEEVECLSCTLTSGLIEPDGGVVTETEFFHAHQDVAYLNKGANYFGFQTSYEVFDELTEEEKVDYINILSKTRKAQREVLGVEHVYYFYNEDTTHHFHTWMVPRYERMYEFGRSVELVRPVLLHVRKEMNTEENMIDVMSAIEALTKELTSVDEAG